MRSGKASNTPMTSGRCRFQRDTENIGGRSKRRLDVRVHDIETGRAREIITLSGGETFIAALSLAPSLSDIVEMTNGAIRLDTIFIDEGFGSLDTGKRRRHARSGAASAPEYRGRTARGRAYLARAFGSAGSSQRFHCSQGNQRESDHG